ncbi:MAG: class I SAM-dependent methyltransferase [Sphingobacteriaceae bacterium]
MTKEWFKNWFDSPYYHTLYHQRNDAEAELFIDNLLAYLHPEPEASFLDIACGRGRHAIYLNKKGFCVTGIDLSESNILFAQEFQQANLNFFVHDMREAIAGESFDTIFNLFTSFGYFDSFEDHVRALQQFNRSAKANGVLVLDYFNTAKIMKHLAPIEHTTIQGIKFRIAKEVLNNQVVKTITFSDKGDNYSFQERVKAFLPADFEKLFAQSGWIIEDRFGDYELNPFDEQASDRLIFICKKAL